MDEPRGRCDGAPTGKGAAGRGRWGQKAMWTSTCTRCWSEQHQGPEAGDALGNTNRKGTMTRCQAVGRAELPVWSGGISLDLVGVGQDRRWPVHSLASQSQV